MKGANRQLKGSKWTTKGSLGELSKTASPVKSKHVKTKLASSGLVHLYPSLFFKKNILAYKNASLCKTGEAEYHGFPHVRRHPLNI